MHREEWRNDLNVFYFRESRRERNPSLHTISCAESTEVVQDAVRSQIQHDSTVYHCFYDHEKAFDLVEYCVLLDHMYKSWKVLAFYACPSGQVSACGLLSKPFILHCGVRQSSVLSPMLFLLVMDSLLIELHEEGAGLSSTVFMLFCQVSKASQHCEVIH